MKFVLRNMVKLLKTSVISNWEHDDGKSRCSRHYF
jgi:hypothetical protein